MTTTGSGRLGAWALVWLALGDAIGAGFFLAAGIAIRAAGPGVLVAYSIGAVLTWLVLRALAELTAFRTVPGSFRVYAEKAFGPMAGFCTGWVYWTALTLGLASEATATALFLQRWLGLPLWLLSVAAGAAVVGMNLLSVTLFGKVEGWLTAAKVVALGLFIAAGVALLAGLWPGRPQAWPGALGAQPWLPGGWAGVAGAMLMVTFGFAGAECLGLAVGETTNPRRTVPRAINLSLAFLLVLYLGSVAVLVFLLPTARVPTGTSPFVAALEARGIGWAGGLMNVVVVAAAFSAMNSALYAGSRMLHSMAAEGQAPAFLCRTARSGQPVGAVAFTAGALGVAVLLAYIMPERAYLYITSASGFALVLVWLVILASHAKWRRRPGSWVGLALGIATLATAPLVPGQWVGLAGGLVLAALAAVAYLLRRRDRRTAPPVPAAAPTPAEPAEPAGAEGPVRT